MQFDIVKTQVMHNFAEQMATYKDYHIKGGTLIKIGIKERQCSELCMRNPYCLAFDYNTVHAQCWFHSGDSYCGVLERRVGCTHYKRIPCVESTARISIISLIFFTNHGAVCTSILWTTIRKNATTR